MHTMERVELTNMCMIYDDERVLVEEKVGKNYRGIVFPGGHVEPEEAFVDSVIREMKEETGLVIEEPVICGIKDWIKEDGSRYIVVLYKTNKFTGELRSSEEGRVFWVEKEKMDSLDLMWNMEELMKIFCSDKFSEFFFKIKNGKWHGELK